MIIAHNERSLFDLNASVEARGGIMHETTGIIMSILSQLMSCSTSFLLISEPSELIQNHPPPPPRVVS